ncbi:predicted protein [Lichtheimia corymbifera JMRC:FSU:9682]|uniref:Uncharacterized protein n=1 Tax=Lichtheimia corymbifera JMRC:FSU:9682 TaxID=1263082 RepID=A0A068S977_9FUNG|nr:predicted protein [Lichtheimia corymbifera JMRC:FSU:9682]
MVVVVCVEDNASFPFYPSSTFIPNSRHPDRGVLKGVQVLRNERGCHGDIVAASCSLLFPLYAWCQQRASLVSRRCLVWRSVSVQQHHTTVFRFPVTNNKGSLCIRKRPLLVRQCKLGHHLFGFDSQPGAGLERVQGSGSLR